MIYVFQAPHLPNLQQECTLKPKILDVAAKSSEKGGNSLFWLQI